MSKGVQEALPKTPSEAFEYFPGTRHDRQQRQMSAVLHRPEVQRILEQIQQEEGKRYLDGTDDEIVSETTVRILQETATKMMQERLPVLQDNMHYLQEQAMIVVERHRPGSRHDSDASNGDGVDTNENNATNYKDQ